MRGGRSSRRYGTGRAARAAAWGAAALGAYLVAAALTLRTGHLAAPVFDGLAPPAAYNWVSPPPEFADVNQPPAPGKGAVELREDGSLPGTIGTDDAQGVVSLPQGAFRARPGEKEVRVTITPLDPAALGSPPEGLRYDGNAYRFEAAYGSGAEAAPAREVTIVLRYPTGATALFRRGASAWETVETRGVGASLQVYGNTTELGTFVAAARHATPPKRSNLLLLVLAGSAVAGALAGLFARRPIGRVLKRGRRKVKRAVKRPPARRRR